MLNIESLTRLYFYWRQSGPSATSAASDADNDTAEGDSPHSEDISGGGVANASLIGAAHGLLRPLILRRLKCDVLGGELPPKVDISCYSKSRCCGNCTHCCYVF
jgi:hypothetical protein